jgi:hypothetical protein
MGKFLAPRITVADLATLTPDESEVLYVEDATPPYYCGGDGSTVGGVPIGGSGGGGTALTQVVVSVNANITAAANTILVIPHGIMTANRTIDISALTTDLQELHILNLERTYSITFAGSPTIYTYGNETYDNSEALRVSWFKIIRLNSELRQNS